MQSSTSSNSVALCDNVTDHGVNAFKLASTVLYSLTHEFESMRRQIDILTNENTKTKAHIDNLLSQVNEQCVNIMTSNIFNGSEQISDCMDRILNLENDIECLDAETNKINRTIASNDDAISQMNRQLHVITAKYIQFNTRINTFLADFRNSNSHSIADRPFNTEHYVDGDAVNFMGDTLTNGHNNSIQIQHNNVSNHYTTNRSNVPTQNSHKCPNYDVYDGLSFGYNIERSIRTMDYINRITIVINNRGQTDFSINELKSIIKIKFNSIFINICKYNNIFVNNISMQGGTVSTARFVVYFDQPVNHICIGKFISQTTSKVLANGINERELSFLMPFRLSNGGA